MKTTQYKSRMVKTMKDKIVPTKNLMVKSMGIKTTPKLKAGQQIGMESGMPETFKSAPVSRRPAVLKNDAARAVMSVTGGTVPVSNTGDYPRISKNKS